MRRPTAFILLALLASVSRAEPEAVSAASLLSSNTGLPLTMDSLTSASVVPERLRQTSPENGFTDSAAKKVLFIVGDPRHESVEWDLVRTAARFFRDAGFETEIRDLYGIGFDPILTRRTFYQAADGFGETPDDAAAEQRFVSAADYVIFASPDWYGSPNAMTKGFMERVFAKGFAYETMPDEQGGLLRGKGFFAIATSSGAGGSDPNDAKRPANCANAILGALARRCGAANLGAFITRETPPNISADYEAQLNALRAGLRDRLRAVFGIEVR